MNHINQKIIDAIVQKAEKCCPDSLALIGVYGSAATGDLHPKSDLDLLILINDDQGWQLATAFILDDVQIGYDLYCTSWQALEDDAACQHAHLSKLLDAKLIYIKDESAVQRLEALRTKACSLLESETRYARVQQALDNAKKLFADCWLCDSLSQVRVAAGAVIHFLLDAVMLSNGRCFHRGVKRTFEELKQLHLPFDPEQLIMNVISSQTTEEVRQNLTVLFQNVQSIPQNTGAKSTPSPDSLEGTYEEMFSNWRNKMHEAADRNDLFSSFMNTVSLQHMLHEIAEETGIHETDVMKHFDPCCLKTNAQNVDHALNGYLQEYQKAGISPKRFSNIDAFLQSYLA